MTHNQTEDGHCCPVFDPEPWDRKTWEWKEKLFLIDFILMATDPTPFRGEYYMSLTKEIPGADMVRLSGNYYTRVFDGPYNAVPKWMRELKADAAAQAVKFVKY